VAEQVLRVMSIRLRASAALAAPRAAAGVVEQHGAGADRADAEAVVTALYEAHALGLVRLAYVMLGDRATAEDIVQEAYSGLYRRWGQLSDQGRALSYVRSSVLNGCRSALRSRRAGDAGGVHQPPAVSAEAAALSSEERREVMRALRRLPDRQREVLVLRFYMDEPEAEIARVMGISPGTVRSTTHRALAALGRLLGETS
jgi:RNA polymerase sigma-70 factor (sigma-E family)